VSKVYYLLSFHVYLDPFMFTMCTNTVEVSAMHCHLKIDFELVTKTWVGQWASYQQLKLHFSFTSSCQQS